MEKIDLTQIGIWIYLPGNDEIQEHCYQKSIHAIISEGSLYELAELENFLTKHFMGLVNIDPANLWTDLTEKKVTQLLGILVQHGAKIDYCFLGDPHETDELP